MWNDIWNDIWTTPSAGDALHRVVGPASTASDATTIEEAETQLTHVKDWAAALDLDIAPQKSTITLLSPSTRVPLSPSSLSWEQLSVLRSLKLLLEQPGAKIQRLCFFPTRCLSGKSWTTQRRFGLLMQSLPRQLAISPSKMQACVGKSSSFRDQNASGP